jgi:hypothetical protein
VCATIIVLVSAGLFVRAVLHGFGRAAGFDVERTVFVSVQEGASFSNPAVDRQQLIAERSSRLTAALRELPGANDVAEGVAPIGREAASGSERPKVVESGGPERQVIAGLMTGTPNLLSTLGVPILAGRGLTAADAGAAAPRAAVITSALAARLWPDGSALGRIVSLPRLRGGPYIVVGIAANLAYGSLTTPASGVLVTTGPGMSSIVSSFVIRTDHPERLAAAIDRTIKGQIVRTATGKEVIARDIARQRLGAWFFSGFGLAALLLGVGGAFGLVAYLAESQRHELGVRLALGADLSDLVRHGLSAAMIPVSVGVAAGLLLGAIASQVFAALLNGVSPLDALTYAAVAVAMLGSAAVSAGAAAWRLRRMSPCDALRAGCLAGMLMLLPAIGSAQNRPNFSGDWILVSATTTALRGAGEVTSAGEKTERPTRSNTASGAAFNCGRECSIVHKGATLTIDKAFLASNTAPAEPITLHVDGHLTTVADSCTPEREIPVSSKWNGDKLEVTSSTGTRTVTQMLSLDAAQLVVVTSIEGDLIPPVTFRYRKK